LPNSVDDLSEFLVVEEEVDELGHLKVIDSDRWLVSGGNGQAPLLCVVV
jgi:hypothetical protein